MNWPEDFYDSNGFNDLNGLSEKAGLEFDLMVLSTLFSFRHFGPICLGFANCRSSNSVQPIWSVGTTQLRIWECGMRIVDCKLKCLTCMLFFQSEIRNQKSEITLTSLLQIRRFVESPSPIFATKEQEGPWFARPIKLIRCWCWPQSFGAVHS